jgi:hypothetical protein
VRSFSRSTRDSEDASWKRYYHEGFQRFVAGTYAGGPQALIAEFEWLLPETPPWNGGH